MLASFHKIVSNFFFPLLLFCFTGSFAQSVNLKDFEKMNTVKSPKEYLTKKDFTIKADTTTGENSRVRMLNRSTHEMIYVSSIKGSEGDKAVDVEYFTESKEEYAQIVHTIIKSGYSAKGDTRHYYKRVGSYETYELVLRELVTIKDKDYYGIKYAYYAGKELATPAPAPAAKKADWTSFPH